MQKQKKSGFVSTKIILIIIGVLVVGGGYVAYKHYYPDFSFTGCTEEAMICPDGSSVGRIPPTCEFAECPAVADLTQEVEPNDFETSTKTEKQIGYIKKVYEKEGKRYLDIDYVQYVTDEYPPKIINQNSLIRTLEIDQNAEIFKWFIYDAKNDIIIESGIKMSYVELKNMFLLDKGGYQDMLFEIWITNGVIIKINWKFVS